MLEIKILFKVGGLKAVDEFLKIVGNKHLLRINYEEFIKFYLNQERVDKNNFAILSYLNLGIIEASVLDDLLVDAPYFKNFSEQEVTILIKRIKFLLPIYDGKLPKFSAYLTKSLENSRDIVDVINVASSNVNLDMAYNKILAYKDINQVITWQQGLVYAECKLELGRKLALSSDYTFEDFKLYILTLENVNVGALYDLLAYYYFFREDNRNKEKLLNLIWEILEEKVKKNGQVAYTEFLNAIEHNMRFTNEMKNSIGLKIVEAKDYDLMVSWLGKISSDVNFQLILELVALGNVNLLVKVIYGIQGYLLEFLIKEIFKNNLGLGYNVLDLAFGLAEFGSIGRLDDVLGITLSICPNYKLSKANALKFLALGSKYYVQLLNSYDFTMEELESITPSDGVLRFTK